MFKLKIALLFLGICLLVFPSFLSAVDETLTITTYYPSPYGSYNEFKVASNTWLAYSSGSVGIGTTAPGKKLSVVGSNDDIIRLSGDTSAAGGKTGILFVQRNTYDDYGGYIRLINTAGTPAYLDPRLDFGVQNTSTNVLTDIGVKMSILGSGNVGIGTTGPSHLLTLSKDAGTCSNPGVAIANLIAFKAYYTGYGVDTVKATIGSGFDGISDWNTDNGLLTFSTSDGGTLIERMRIMAHGNVGIGMVSPAKLLQLGNNSDGEVIRIGRTDNTHHVGIGATGFGNNLIFYANGVEKVRMDINGNVGIGTTAPGTNMKLQVVGDIIGNAQVFRAYMTSSFSKAAGTWEKIPFNATIFNTLQGTFSGNRFTASRAGYYQISVTGYSTTAGTGSERYAIGVYKNGGNEGFVGSNYSAADTPLVGPSMIAYMNGTTDYVEIWMFSAIAATLGGGSSGGHYMLWHMNYLGT